MLKFLSQQHRARNAFVVFFIAVMAASLVIFLGTPIGKWVKGSNETEAEADATSVVAEVNGDEITTHELQQALSRISQGGQNLQFAKTFSDDLLDQLIQRRVVTEEAKRLGITVTDEELRREIARQVPTFVNDKGRFITFDQYRRAIEGSGSKVEEFEDGIRQSLLDQKLRTYVTAGVTVSQHDVEEDYAHQNTTANVSYVVLDPKKYENQVDVSDTEAQGYFDQHKDEFKINELERKVDYIYIPHATLQSKVTVTDQEVSQEYDRTKSDQILSATVSQIVFPFNETNESDVRAKADDVVKKARGDDKTPAEDFAKLGGKSIGDVKRDTKDTSYKQRVFTLAQAQKNVTEPFKEGEAFYVLKATQLNHKSLAEAKPELVKEIKGRKARTDANTLADEIKKKLTETKAINKTAEEFRAKLGNVPLDQIVRHTGFFATSDQLPEFDTYSSSFTSGASNLNENGQVGNQIYLKDGLAIPQLVEKRDPHTPTFDEVKERVMTKLRKQKAAEKARQRADELAKQASGAEALAGIAKGEGVEVKKAPEFKRGTIPPDLEQSNQLEGFAFSVPVGKVAPQAIKVGEKYVILGVNSRKEADLTKLAEQQEATRKRLLDQRRGQLFQAYIQQIKDQLAKEGRIIVYQKVFDSIAGGAGGNLNDLLNITPSGQ